MMGKMAWLKVVAQNRHIILKLVREAFLGRRPRPMNPDTQDAYKPVAATDVPGELKA
jgi:hypothetical protein